MKRWMICSLMLLLGVVGVWGQDATPEITPEAIVLPLLGRYPESWSEITFNYPLDWMFVQFPTDFSAYYIYQFALHNSFTVLGKESLVGYSGYAEYDSGEVTVQIRLRYCDATYPAEELVTQDFYRLSPDPYLIPDVDYIQVGSQNVARTRMFTTYGDSMFLLLTFRPRLHCVLILISTAKGELSQWEPTALAIAESVELHMSIG